MGGWPRFAVKGAALGVAVAVGLLAGVADARTWKQWAPDPLASDSAYAAFVARPADSLTAAQLSWLAVQRDWRAQRQAETVSYSPRSITDAGRPHPPRRSDARFAVLASRPYEALTDTDRAWLVAENAAQQVAHEAPGGGAGVVGIVLLAALAGVMIGAILVVHAMRDSAIPWTF